MRAELADPLWSEHREEVDIRSCGGRPIVRWAARRVCETSDNADRCQLQETSSIDEHDPYIVAVTTPAVETMTFAGAVNPKSGKASQAPCAQTLL